MVLNEACVKCHIFTYKEGLLSAFAHDLKLQVSKFEISVEKPDKNTALWQKVSASFEAASIRSVCAMKSGVKAPGILSRQNGMDIETNIANDVLNPKAFPFIRFQSENISGTARTFNVKGRLTILDTTRTINIPVKQVRNKLLAKFTLDQTDFGIEPFSAMMGAMRIKPEILITLECPLNKTHF